MVAKYSSMAGMPDLPAPLKRYRMPTQEQLNEATNLIVSYNEMGPLERANFALRRTPPTQVGYRAGMGMQNLQEDLADALRMHFAVYGGDNLIHIKNLDDLDVLASQYGEALRQRSGWLEEVIQESPIAQLEMAVPNPMVSAAQTMGLDTYATLLQFRDRMSDAIQNGAGVRMRLGASLEQIETSGTLLTQEDLLGYGIRVDGAGDPLNVAGVIHSEINEGLKTTFHIMPGGRIYAVQTPTGPKGLRNAYHAAIGSALHRELGLALSLIHI